MRKVELCIIALIVIFATALMFQWPQASAAKPDRGMSSTQITKKQYRLAVKKAKKCKRKARKTLRFDAVQKCDKKLERLLTRKAPALKVVR